MEEKVLVYDGTFEGFLSAVFYTYEYKLKQVSIQKESQVQNALFADTETIVTNTEHADRVWKGLKTKLTVIGKNHIYYSFLSELPNVEATLFDYIQQVFKHKDCIEKDYANPSVLKLSKIRKSVGREKHRMEAFVRFKLTKDWIYFANIEPDFDVLPLIIRHFKSRYADQKWLIYDIKRQYGIFYDLQKVESIEMVFPDGFDFTKTSNDFFASEEFDFQTLWQDYFKSTNIESRKNTQLHIRHVPKRYWKYLSEKQL